MTPLDLARRYLEIFYSGSDIDALRPLFADDLSFEGPFYTFDTAEAYLDSLRAAPPEGMTYDVIRAFESASSACVIYQFSKAGIQTPMAQLFEVDAGVIKRILLVFDTGAFA